VKRKQNKAARARARARNRRKLDQSYRIKARRAQRAQRSGDPYWAFIEEDEAAGDEAESGN
jgi:hypothetical protein